MTPPPNYIEAVGHHRSNEDQSVYFPIDLGTSTEATLAGATARARVVCGASELIWEGAGCVINAAEKRIELSKSKNDFQGKVVGAYVGDLRLTLADGQNIVTHLITFNLKPGYA